MRIIDDRKTQNSDAMIDYATKNEQILKEWSSAAKKNDEDKEFAFVYDGLLRRGVIYYDGKIWKRKSAKENKLWNQSFPRIMLITKDFNDQDGHESDDIIDLREETLRRNYTGEDHVVTSQIQFHKNILFHVFGLGKYKNGRCPKWDDLYYDESREYYESCPLVRINVKKQAGGGCVSDSTIRKYIERYKQYLNRQISLFDADIIVCYGRVIFDYIIQEFFSDIEPSKEDPWVYFSEEKQKVIINSYHPSVRGTTITDEQFYTCPINEFEQMMLKHPEFADKYIHKR